MSAVPAVVFLVLVLVIPAFPVAVVTAPRFLFRLRTWLLLSSLPLDILLLPASLLLL